MQPRPFWCGGGEGGGGADLGLGSHHRLPYQSSIVKGAPEWHDSSNQRPLHISVPPPIFAVPHALFRRSAVSAHRLCAQPGGRCRGGGGGRKGREEGMAAL